MKTKTSSRSLSSSSQPPPPTREQIHALAHALWIDRGCPQGCDVEIWLDAERQLGGGPGRISSNGERVDVEDSEAANVDRELDSIVSPPEQRSPTSL